MRAMEKMITFRIRVQTAFFVFLIHFVLRVTDKVLFRSSGYSFPSSGAAPVRFTLVFSAFSAFTANRAALRVATRLNTASSSRFRKRDPGVRFTFCWQGCTLVRFPLRYCECPKKNRPDRPIGFSDPPKAVRACSPLP